ncbi:MAG: alpha/beta fold hydrolase, partial [Vulcanimicrobiaceae bacterium]
SFTTPMRAARAKALLGMFASLTPAQFAASNARYMASIGTRDPRLAERLANAADRSDPAAMAEFASEDLAMDLRPQLSSITIPVLLISPYYAADFSTPPMKFSAVQKAAYYALLTPGIAHEKIVTISPARHYAQLDQPQETQEAIDAFLTSLP